uniref:GLTP domain-containing protein n=1 Tax=Onchocerca volvulus TaxID=6282 RepID=A0A8R1XYI7_ONCVO
MDLVQLDEVSTYFSHPELMFPMIENDKVPTEQFLRACQGIADFVGFLGTAFIPIKNDISGNVTKVRTKYESEKGKCKYIEDLIEDDLAKNNGKMGVATEGLLWLKRGLEFMLEFLSEMVQVYRSSIDKEKTNSLTGSINNAYNNTLKRHHGFISKQLFKVVILAAPTRSTILKILAEGEEGLDDICIEHIAAHLDNFRINVAHIVNYYIKKKLDTPNPLLTRKLLIN